MYITKDLENKTTWLPKIQIIACGEKGFKALLGYKKPPIDISYCSSFSLESARCIVMDNWLKGITYQGDKICFVAHSDDADGLQFMLNEMVEIREGNPYTILFLIAPENLDIERIDFLGGAVHRLVFLPTNDDDNITKATQQALDACVDLLPISETDSDKFHHWTQPVDDVRHSSIDDTISLTPKDYRVTITVNGQSAASCQQQAIDELLARGLVMKWILPNYKKNKSYHLSSIFRDIHMTVKADGRDMYDAVNFVRDNGGEGVCYFAMKDADDVHEIQLQGIFHTEKSLINDDR